MGLFEYNDVFLVNTSSCTSCIEDKLLYICLFIGVVVLCSSDSNLLSIHKTVGHTDSYDKVVSSH